MKTPRICAVCGKLGGANFAVALRLLGFPLTNGFAHPVCIARIQQAKRSSS
jgi:hypothetical protein